LGLETGIVVAITKIIIHHATQWTWFNLFTEPVYLMAFGSLIGLIFSKKN